MKRELKAPIRNCFSTAVLPSKSCESHKTEAVKFRRLSSVVTVICLLDDLLEVQMSFSVENDQLVSAFTV
jgi:hypothetical protein